MIGTSEKHCVDIQRREQASQLIAAHSHPTRLRIIELLCRGERSVNPIAGELNLFQSGTSQDLAVFAALDSGVS